MCAKCKSNFQKTAGQCVLCDQPNYVSIFVLLAGYSAFGAYTYYSSQFVGADNFIGILTTFFQFFGLFAKGRLKDEGLNAILRVIFGFFSADTLSMSSGGESASSSVTVPSILAHDSTRSHHIVMPGQVASAW